MSHEEELARLRAENARLDRIAMDYYERLTGEAQRRDRAASVRHCRAPHRPDQPSRRLGSPIPQCCCAPRRIYAARNGRD